MAEASFPWVGWSKNKFKTCIPKGDAVDRNPSWQQLCFPQPTSDKELQLLKEQVMFLGTDEIWRELLTSLGAGTPRCGTWILDLWHCTVQGYSGLEVSVGYRYVLSGGSFRTCLSETNRVTAQSFTEVHCKRVKLINCYEFFAFRAAKQRHTLLKSVLFKNFLQWQIL